MRAPDWPRGGALDTPGHPAAGATAVGAYNPFTPEIPEPFTSAGGDLVFPFDANGNRLARPEIRRKPEISATDGGNTTFFVADTIRDDDDFPNFFGTSAPRRTPRRSPPWCSTAAAAARR